MYNDYAVKVKKKKGQKVRQNVLRMRRVKKIESGWGSSGKDGRTSEVLLLNS